MATGDGGVVQRDLRGISYQSGSIYTVIKATGGRLPPAKKRRSDALTLHDLEETCRDLASGELLGQLTCVLVRWASTISWEAAKNKGHHHYRAADPGGRPPARTNPSMPPISLGNATSLPTLRSFATVPGDTRL